MQCTNAIAFALLQAVFRRQTFVFGFQNGERNGFCSWRERMPENVIRSTCRTPPGVVIDDVDRLGRFLHANVRTFPFALTESGID